MSAALLGALVVAAALSFAAASPAGAHTMQASEFGYTHWNYGNPSDCEARKAAFFSGSDGGQDHSDTCALQAYRPDGEADQLSEVWLRGPSYGTHVHVTTSLGPDNCTDTAWSQISWFCRPATVHVTIHGAGQVAGVGQHCTGTAYNQGGPDSTYQCDTTTFPEPPYNSWGGNVCPPTCTSPYGSYGLFDGSDYTFGSAHLYAQPDPGYKTTGWTGCDITGATTYDNTPVFCDVHFNSTSAPAAKNVDVYFTPTGDGSGGGGGGDAGGGGGGAGGGGGGGGGAGGDGGGGCTAPPGSPDGDHDQVADVCDNCPTVPNADQQDLDRDGVGDACEFLGDVGATCGKAGIDWHLINGGGASVHKHDPACMFLLSNRAVRELISLARRHGATETDAFAALAQHILETKHAQKALLVTFVKHYTEPLSLSKRILRVAFRQFAGTLGRINLIFTVGTIVGRSVVPLTIALHLHEIYQEDACQAFFVSIHKKHGKPQLHVESQLVYNPANVAPDQTNELTFAGAYEKTHSGLFTDTFERRNSNLHCGRGGEVVRSLPRDTFRIFRGDTVTAVYSGSKVK